MTEGDQGLRKELTKVFDALSWNLTVADSFLRVHKGLLLEVRVHTIALVAPTFFRMTLAAMYDTAFLTLARIFDLKPGTVRLLHFLDLAEKTAGMFEHATPEEVRAIVKECKSKIESAQPLLEPLRARRNKMLAHLDKRFVLNPQDVDKEIVTTDSEWEELVTTAADVLNKIRVAFDGLMFSGELLDWEDYTNLVHVLREGKKKQISDYETEFGIWPYPEQKEDLGM
jgi:hypothetical protein